MHTDLSGFHPMIVAPLTLEQANFWMQQNVLQLSKGKTEVIVFGRRDERLKVNAYLESKPIKTCQKSRRPT